MEEKNIIKQLKSEDGVIKLNFKPYEVEHLQQGNEIIYSLVDPYLIYHLLITYKKSLLNDKILRNAFDYVNYMVSTGVPEKIISPRKAIDEVVDIFSYIFPLPFRA
jgi:hypothetical protein